MRDLTVVWVDLRAGPAESSPVPVAAAGWPLARVGSCGAIEGALPAGRPAVLCFEFDAPDRAGLLAVGEVKARHPGLPILMLTESHSESLAVWALRVRVWDYLVAPVPVEGLRERLRVLSAIGPLSDRRLNVYPAPTLPPEVRVRVRRPGDVTHAAHDYLLQHFDEPLGARRMAELCRLSTSEFCRAYKREHGMPFGEALLRTRIAAACELLRSQQAVIADVAYAVGFNDPSYFSRVFRRYSGMSASSYRLGELTRRQARETRAASGHLPYRIRVEG